MDRTPGRQVSQKFQTSLVCGKCKFANKFKLQTGLTTEIDKYNSCITTSRDICCNEILISMQKQKMMLLLMILCFEQNIPTDMQV